MKCQHCNNEFEGKICNSCGAPAPNQEQPPKPSNSVQPQKPPQKNLKKWIIIAGGSVVAILALIIISIVTGNITVTPANASSVIPSSETSSKDDAPSSKAADKKQSSNVLLNLDVLTEDVMNGSGDAVLGQRAYVMIDKETIMSLPYEDFIEFVDKSVVNSGYNYFSIVFDDGTGIQFPGSMKEIVLYGALTDDDIIDYELEYVYIELKSDGTYSLVEPTK